MNKFFIFTRGRSGSTAIIDELNSHPQCVCHGEIFRRDPLRNPKVKKAYEEMGVEYLKLRLTNDQAIPYGLWKKIEKNTHKSIIDYLDFLETDAASKGYGAMGFKFLHNYVVEMPDLLKNLKKYEYKAIHLIRRNVVRQVISGMVAAKRGVYNSRKYKVTHEKYLLDIKEFAIKIKLNIKQVNDADKMLAELGFSKFDIYYEDFLKDRNGFHRFILEKLGLSFDELTPSSFTIMVPSDLRTVIENYDEISKSARSLGFGHFLSE